MSVGAPIEGSWLGAGGDRARLGLGLNGVTSELLRYEVSAVRRSVG